MNILLLWPILRLFKLLMVECAIFNEDDTLNDHTSSGIYILPKIFKPLHYYTKLVLLSEESTFSGESIIDMICTNATNKLIMHSSNLEILSYHIINLPNVPISISVDNIETNRNGFKNESSSINDSYQQFIKSITIDKNLNIVPNKRTNIQFPITNNYVMNGWNELFDENYLFNNNIKSSSRETDYSQMKTDENKEIVIFPLDKVANIGDQLRLQVKYRGKYSNTLEGLYKATYTNDDSGQQKVVIATHFEPIGARTVFPCFDEPIYKANFTIAIVHESNKRAVSNSKVSSIKPHDDFAGMMITEFYPTVKTSSYLIAFAVMDYISMQLDLPNNCTVSIMAPYIYKNQLDLAANVTLKVLPFYEGFFGEPYSLDKLDLMAIPEFVSGAMENWGLLTFRNTYLIYDKSRSSNDNRKQIITVICHELAHQWFGNLVTMKWWDDIWLNEGFANYIELIGANFFDPSLKIIDQQLISGWSSALEMDSMNNTRAISSTIYSAVTIDEMFDVISYSKGAAMLRMLHAFMGDDAFISGIRSYIQKFKYNNAGTRDLWMEFNQFFPSANIKTIMDSWIEQKGYPLINLKSNPDNNIVTISQQSYLKMKASIINKRDDINPLENLWYVPINIMTNEPNGNISTVLLTPVSDMEINVGHNIKWLKLNAGVSGYFVVNYDKNGWNLLIDQLKTNHSVFTPVDRAGLIHDAFKLACDGIISPVIPLELISYMIKENDYLPWAMLRSKHSCLSEVIGKNEVATLYKVYIWNLQKHLVDLDILIQSDDPNELSQQYEVALFALKYGTIPVLKSTITELFEFLLQKNLTGFKYPEIRTLALLFGVDRKNKTQFKLLWQSYVNSFSDYDKKFLMKNLASFTSVENTLINLNNILNLNVVKIQDTLTFLLTVYKLCFDKNVCWDYIENNWKKLIYRFPAEALNDFILSIVTVTSDKNILLRIQLFLAKHTIEKHSIVGKQIEEKIILKTNDEYNQWKIKSFCEIAEWIYRHKNKQPPFLILKKCSQFTNINLLNF